MTQRTFNIIMACKGILFGHVRDGADRVRHYMADEIGDGESGMDTFFSSDALVSWRKADVFEKNVEDAGYPVDCIEHRSFFLHGEEVNETED